MADAPDPPGLTIAGVWKRYGPTVALSDVTLAIPPGEFFVLLGGSGSGKTTLLRLLAGFVTPDAGQVRLDGVDIGPLPPHRRPTNMMFQSYALFPHMNVAGNVAYGLRRAGWDRRAIAARVAELLALLGLEELAARRPDALSGGQQQRVALARALARRPRVLLLDEPLSALDRALRLATRDELAAVQRRLGTTFVLVTHDQEEALSLATRLGVMRDGALVQVGPPRAVYERPADRDVAAFLGGANVLPARIGAAGPPAMLHVKSIPHPITLAAAAPAPAGTEVWFMLRPGCVRAAPAGDGVAGDGASAGCNHATGTLIGESFQGETIQRTLRLDDGAPLRFSARPGETAMIGARIRVVWNDTDGAILLS